MGRPLAVLLAAAALLAGAAPARAQSPALAAPSDRLAAALECTGSLAGAPAAPVLLVPGTGEDPEFFAWNYARARAGSGRPFCTVRLPEHGTGDVQVAAEYVVHAIRTMHARAGRRIAVIGHSQGGMVPRWALRWWPDTRAMVDDLVGLAASNHGTTAARAACALGCNAAAWQQRDDSRFIAALNAPQETWAGISYTSVYTRLDEIVTPNQDETGSTSLRTGDGARSNVRVQDVCPANVAEHLYLGSADAVGYAAATDALGHPGPADPARIPASVCALPFHEGVNPATFATDSAASYATVLANFASGAILPAEPPLACYAGGPCAGGGTGSGGGGASAGGGGTPATGGGRPQARALAALRVSLSTRRVRAGRRATLRVRVTARVRGAVRPVAGARVTLAGRRVRTDRRGRATLRKRFVTPGRRTLVASLAGFRPARATVLVRRR